MKEKDEIYAPGWDAITEEFERIYPDQKNPKHYATLISWSLGGPDPLQGISVYETEDYWHFVSYGLSELYEKVNDDKKISGFGMEFTLKLKKRNYDDTEGELKCIAGIFQSLARLTFLEQELFHPFEYVYSGQESGFDLNGKSALTGFITIPDTLAHTIETPNGKVEFVEFIGVTDAELNMLVNKKLEVKDLYKKLGSDITDYERESCF